MVIHRTCFILIICFVYLQPDAVYLYVFSIVFFFCCCNFRFCVFTAGCFLYLYFISIVPVHEPKSQSIQRNAKKWNTSFIVVFHLVVTMRPSTIILTHTLHISIHTRSTCACPKPRTCRRWLYLFMNCLVFFFFIFIVTN